ncbi:MAG: hypothetical protein RJA52_745 [Bacteroidota bacterium]
MMKFFISYSLFFIGISGFSQSQILIAYYSKDGSTQKMAEAVATGVLEEDGIEIILLPVDQVTQEILKKSEAIILGSPVYNANVAPEVSAFIASWPFEGEPLKNKIGAAFVSGGGISGGEELVQINILQSMLIFGMIIVGGPDSLQPFGASAITFEQNLEMDIFLEKGKKLGKRVAEITKRFNVIRE